MNRRHLAELTFAWDASALPIDPIEPMLPIEIAPVAVDAARAARAADVTLTCTLAPEPLPCPVAPTSIPILTHGKTACYPIEPGLVIWDGASQLYVLDHGRRIELRVHASSIARPFHFSSVAVTMALLLSLRYHGYFHMHAAAARFEDGQTWLIPGESGAGKSTLALSLFVAGAQWLSDDALLLRVHDGELEVIGWARHARMTTQTSAAFPELSDMLVRCPQESARQWQVDPRVAFPGRGLVSARPPFTLVFPHFGEGPKCSVSALERADAFGRALHASGWVVADLLVARKEQLALLARLVEGARAFDAAVSGRVLIDPKSTVAELRALLS